MLGTSAAWRHPAVGNGCASTILTSNSNTSEQLGVMMMLVVLFMLWQGVSLTLMLSVIFWPSTMAKLA